MNNLSVNWLSEFFYRKCLSKFRPLGLIFNCLYAQAAYQMCLQSKLPPPDTFQNI